jgi:exodeoxyribonuclease VII small subunit
MAGKKPATGKGSFEESLHRLEEIVNQLEQGDVPLEDSLRLYEEGIQLSRVCAEKLTRAETTLKKLNKDLDGKLTLMDEEQE